MIANLFGDGRVLVWFSCGAASAVAAKLTTDWIRGEGRPVELLCCDTLRFEHPDNRRFLNDVLRWTGTQIDLLHSRKFSDIYDVFTRERYLKGPSGAPCTRALKQNVRKEYQRPGDVHIFGYTVEEDDRIERFERENRGIECAFPLHAWGITKSDCYRIIREAGIKMPAMYLLGYKNNNCIGCVKGGAGYWNKIRIDFPGAFDRMAEMERTLNFALLRVKGKPCFLDELPPGIGRYDGEPDIECGPQCAFPEPTEASP